MNLVRLQDTNFMTRTLFHSYTLTNNERSEREIKKTIPFTITSKRIKYLGINLTKDAKERLVHPKL